MKKKKLRESLKILRYVFLDFLMMLQRKTSKSFLTDYARWHLWTFWLIVTPEDQRVWHLLNSPLKLTWIWLWATTVANTWVVIWILNNRKLENKDNKQAVIVVIPIYPACLLLFLLEILVSQQMNNLYRRFSIKSVVLSAAELPKIRKVTVEVSATLILIPPKMPHLL